MAEGAAEGVEGAAVGALAGAAAAVGAAADLDARLLVAHAADARHALTALYAEAAEASAATDRRCFFLTQAWIFALDSGDIAAGALHARLQAEGRV